MFDFLAKILIKAASEFSPTPFILACDSRGGGCHRLHLSIQNSYADNTLEEFVCLSHNGGQKYVTSLVQSAFEGRSRHFFTDDSLMREEWAEKNGGNQDGDSVKVIVHASMFLYLFPLKVFFFYCKRGSPWNSP